MKCPLVRLSGLRRMTFLSRVVPNLLISIYLPLLVILNHFSTSSQVALYKTTL